jgi:hypothetical protein
MMSREIKVARVRGRDLAEMRQNVPKEIHNRGDTVLIWINEGDLYLPGEVTLCVTELDEPCA